MRLLAYLEARLRQLQEELARLITCQSLLSAKQQEFSENAKKCLEPELSTNTWHGNHATEFQTIRREGIHESYMEIVDKQFTKALKVLSDKIASHHKEIIVVKATIAALRAAQMAMRSITK